METAWFIVVAVLIVAYAVLDGFDLGAGMLHMFIAKTDAERRTILHSIGPVWDGNEVCLVAGGGTLYFAFPLLYASSFSGFYLPLNIVLWLLILRGVGIDFRMHTENEVVTGLFDGFFALASSLLALFLGAALGNVIRGVSIGPDYYFFEPLWTTLLPWGETGILDWYTIFTGVFSVTALLVHGALWVSLKSKGEIHDRTRNVASRVIPLLMLITAIGVPLTIFVRPATMHNYSEYPILYFFPTVAALSLGMMWNWNRKGEELRAFLSSCAYLIAILAGAASAIYPALLPASNDPQRDITIYNAATGQYAMRVGFWWWGLAIGLATGYFIFVYYMFRGKLESEIPAQHRGRIS